jgi:hypothetical protein
VVSGLLIPARWLRAAENRWRDFIRDNAGKPSGRIELKSRDLFKGKGVAYQIAQDRSRGAARGTSSLVAGHDFYQDALKHIASIQEARILTVGVDSKYPVETYRLWFWLAYTALTERPKSPRPRLPMTVIDGEDAALRRAHDLIAYRFYRAFRGRSRTSQIGDCGSSAAASTRTVLCCRLSRWRI